ncbi:MAG TPA: hypothetical protein PKM25_13535, partial [Candidatus Ozemobacteraceae bacterium]|nr:hypothetical protein [Candidatus Ozemobacteraceae bacterium]
MKNKTLRFMCRLLCLVLVASFVLEAPLMALETIPVSVGGQQFQVTPGQWVSVRQGTQIVHYNVRYVNGRPVALEMSQYVKLVFGEASVPATTGTSGSTGSTSQSGSTSQKPATSGTSKTAPSSSSNANSTSVSNSNTSNSQATTANTAKQLPARDPVTGRFVKSTDANTAANTTGNANSNTTANNTANNSSSNVSGAQPANTGSQVVADGSSVGTVAQAPADAAAQTTSGKTFDPAAHPRDPVTGRFIKRDSTTTGAAQTGETGQTGQTSQTGQSSQSGSSDGAGLPTNDGGQASGQSGQNTSDPALPADDGAGQVGQAGQSEQGGQAGQTTEGKQSFKDKMGDRFQSGYATGKSMTNQGVQNVKDSLKSGFSAKNLLVTAGITVGVDLATQIMRGEKPSAKKALKTVCSAEFAGGVVGSVTGAAAGSFFVPFLSAVPVVGGFLGALAPTFGSIVGGSMGSYLAGDLKNGKFSLKAAFKQIDWIGVAGQTVGSTVGAMLGSAIFPPFGTIIGGMVGGYLGNLAAHKIAGLFGKDKQSGNATIAMPTGNNPIGGQTGVDGSVTIGNAGSTTSNSTTGTQESITIPGDTAQVGTYDSEVQLAYARYQELYNLYNELVKQGRQEDSVKIAAEMNKAKASFDEL